MEYRILKNHANSLRELAFLLDRLDDRPKTDDELVGEMASLRHTIQNLESTMDRACDGIEAVASLLCDALNPEPFPEPLRFHPSTREPELSSNGLLDLSGFEDDVPF